MPSQRKKSLTRFDNEYRRKWQIDYLCGIDEAGRGCLAGPVVAAAVIFKPGTTIPGLNDSKQIKPQKREALFQKIISKALTVTIGWASAEEIDKINILQATHLAAQRAIAMLKPEPEAFLTDYLKLKVPNNIPIDPLAKGDSLSQSIAAASIIAKVTRDRWLVALDDQFPGYSLAQHKGYGTKPHMEAIQRLGSSTLHRQTFAGVSWFDAEPVPSHICRKLLKRPFKATIEANTMFEQWQKVSAYLPEIEERLIQKSLQIREKDWKPKKNTRMM